MTVKQLSPGLVGKTVKANGKTMVVDSLLTSDWSKGIKASCDGHTYIFTECIKENNYQKVNSGNLSQVELIKK